jgi:hypothetical protein
MSASGAPLKVVREDEAKHESKDEEKNSAITPYQKRLAIYLEASKELSSLEKHVYLFLDKDKVFNSTTIAAALTKMHGSASTAKGRMIALFNASHGSGNIICPAMKATFSKDANGYARFLHLGTTRIWNADGSFNAARWQDLVSFTNLKQNDAGILTLSQLKAYLTTRLATDQPDPNSGRNTNAFFSSKRVQAFAATAAWDEVFDRLACGWKAIEGKSNQWEPYLTLEILKEFFEDSPRAFLRAECGLLPVLKPKANEKIILASKIS